MIGWLTWYSIVTLWESVVVAEIICTAGAAVEARAGHPPRLEGLDRPR